MDFTFKKYEELCRIISRPGYKNLTLEEYLRKPQKNKFIILRHDVDKKPKNALEIAKIEKKYGLKSTFYFRMKTFDKEIMKEIKRLGHEIGYQYECLDEADGDYQKALEIFEKNIEKFRDFDVKTIAMHGGIRIQDFLPRWKNKDKWKNRDLWNKNKCKYDFKKFGIIGEPYLSIDYSGVSRPEYLSDTSRSWNLKYKVKDFPDNYKPRVKIKKTDELIGFIKKGDMSMCILAHPDKWNNCIFPWFKELIFQNSKNMVKLFLNKC